MNKALSWLIDIILVCVIVFVADMRDVSATDALAGFMALKLAQIANKD